MGNFDDPFDMLEASHRRLGERLDELERATATLCRDPRDEEARERVGDVVSYLTRSVVRHERDEEESLFPLVELRGGDTESVPELLAMLRAEHRQQEAAVARLTQLSAEEKWVEARELSETLSTSYREHAAAEEVELFPLARLLLGADERKQMLTAMEARRSKGSRRTGEGRDGGGGGRGGGGGGGGGRRRRDD